MRHCVNLRQKRFDCSSHTHARAHTQREDTPHMHSTQAPDTHHPHAHATQDTHAPTLFSRPLPYPHPRCQLLPLFLSFTAHPTLYANLTDPNILWRIFFLFKRSVLPVCCSRTVSLNLSPNFILPSSLSPCGETSTFVGSSLPEIW